jgi:hypothetical protein
MPKERWLVEYRERRRNARGGIDTRPRRAIVTAHSDSDAAKIIRNMQHRDKQVTDISIVEISRAK